MIGSSRFRERLGESRTDFSWEQRKRPYLDRQKALEFLVCFVSRIPTCYNTPNRIKSFRSGYALSLNGGMNSVLIFGFDLREMTTLPLLPTGCAGSTFRESEKLAPEVGLEPTTNRLTADRSTTELLRNEKGREKYLCASWESRENAPRQRKEKSAALEKNDATGHQFSRSRGIIGRRGPRGLWTG